MNLSTLSKLSPRTILLGLAGAAMFGVFALVVAVIVIWRSTSGFRLACQSGGRHCRAGLPVGRARDRALEGTHGTMAVAEAARALEDARTSFDRTRDALADRRLHSPAWPM